MKQLRDYHSFLYARKAMLYKRICGAQNMSYSMIRSCVKDYSWICLFECSVADNLRKHLSAYQVKNNNHFLTRRFFSVRDNSERDFMGMDKSFGSEQRYQIMLENLRAQSSKPKEIRIKLNPFGKAKKSSQLKDKASLDKTLGTPPVIQALVPSLLLTRYRSRFRKSDNHEYVLEVGEPVRISKAYDSLCLQLNVPYCLGEGFPGHKALLKLCLATKPGDSIYSYCADTDIEAIDEVFKVAAHRIKVADHHDLMNLLYYRYFVQDFSAACYRKLFLTFVQIMRDNEINVNDLMDFLNRIQICDSSKFSELEKKDLDDLIKSICYHLAVESSRTIGILKQVYSITPTKYDAIFLLLNKILMENLDKLDVCDAILIHKEIQNRANNAVVLKELSSWISENFDKVTLNDIGKIMPSLIDSDYRSELMLTVFDKVLISTQIKDISTTILVQILSYCSTAKFYNDSVLETACDHYVEDKKGYSSQQLLTLLKAIGTLNFTPEKCEDFFTKVEMQLINNFYSSSVRAVLEMIVYLIYLDRFPLNLMDHIFSDQFSQSILGMEKEGRVLADKYLRIIYREASLISDERHLTLPEDPTLQWKNNGASPYNQILPVFSSIVKDVGQVNVRSKPTGSGTYLEMAFDDIAQSLNRSGNYPNDKLAFMVMTGDSFCKNKGFTQHMIGEEMVNIRLLQEEGLTVVWIPADKVKELVAHKSLSAFARKLFLKVIKTD